MVVEKLVDREELRSFLMSDPLANAYLLGNLDPAYFQFCEWFGSRDEEGKLRNLLLVYRGLSIPVVFSSGNGEGLGSFLDESRAILPKRFHFHVLEEQMGALKATYSPEGATRMIRMGQDRALYKATTIDERVERLGHRDTGAIMELYSHYPDHFFEPYQLETGLYFGIRDEEEALMSIAGVHVVSETHDVAVIGNLVTHSSHRGKGLATLCTARLIAELFERVSLLALNVGEENTVAIKLYENLGFRANNVFYEGRYSEQNLEAAS